MKQLFLLIVLGSAGYLGFLAYKGELPDSLKQYLPQFQTAAPGAAAVIPASTQPPAELPPAVPAYVSKVDMPADAAPGEKHVAPPGVFYVVERASVETDTGIHAVVPGDMVKLMKRNSNGTLLLTDGEVSFTARETQVTNDLDLAKAAEAKDRSVYRGKR
jgi:hypothetical protein